MTPAAETPRPFVFVLHNHQPVGNFEHVFADAFERCYRPVVESLARHPEIKVGLHFTGSLLEWIARERRSYLDQVRGLVDRGQVEILGGGFYEPILSTLTDTDAAGQIEMMAMFCERHFGRRPSGMWLAERVWDPDLPRLLAPNGIRYTLLDDSHFRAAGVVDEVITGHYLTEKAGHTLSIFPIDKGLRYRIPFSEPEQVLAYLASAPGKRCLTYGDDGEKFGLWPSTYEWVFEKRWLERFFSAIEEAERDRKIRMVLPADYLDEERPAGRLYLPNASYEEMMEWALPVAGMRRLHELRERLKRSGEYETYGPYLRGGIWQNFLAKYPEANQIHKKMLYVSERLQSAMQDAMGAKNGAIDEETADLLGSAQRELYRGQCCCAYWHGLFGGLYLNYLRDALYRSLLSAEQILDRLQHGNEDWLSYEEEDIDVDGREEILISNRLVNVYVRPHAGGTVFEMDYKPRAFNITNTITRREEGYHELIAKNAGASNELGSAPKTIHDIVRVKEEGLDRVLVYDDVPRASFVDRFLPLEPSLDMVRALAGGDRGDFAGAEYRIESMGVDRGDQRFHLSMWRRGVARAPSSDAHVTIQKTFELEIDSSRLRVRYVITNDEPRPIEAVFGTELNLNLLAGNDPSRYVVLDGVPERFSLASAGVAERVGQLSLVDEWMKISVVLSFETPATLFRYPIETVSQSENGLERTYQGTCFLPAWPLRLDAGARIELLLGVVVREADEG